MIPALGIIPDLLDAAYYLFEGDLINAGVAGMAAIPLAGLFTRGGQYFYKFLKFGERYLPDAVNLGKKAARFGKKYFDDILRRIGVPQIPPQKLFRVTEPGKPKFHLKKGEEGLSVFDADNLDADDILPSFRPGSELTTKTTQEITDLGLTVQKTPGDPNLPTKLQDNHFEIRPGSDMSRKQFKKTIKTLE